jgi:hypothetical protein
MRHLIIQKLKVVIEQNKPDGIPRYFDCEEDECITDLEALHMLTDEELLSVYDITIGFWG